MSIELSSTPISVKSTKGSLTWSFALPDMEFRLGFHQCGKFHKQIVPHTLDLFLPYLRSTHLSSIRFLTELHLREQNLKIRVLLAQSIQSLLFCFRPMYMYDILVIEILNIMLSFNINISKLYIQDNATNLQTTNRF